MIEVREFDLDKKYESSLEALLLQLSGKERKLSLENHSNVYNVGAFDNENLVGFAQLFVLPKTTFTMGLLEDVIVLEKCRGQGIGKRILEAVIQIAKREGCVVINLTTRPERAAAVKLFESAGFAHPGNMTYRLNLES